MADLRTPFPAGSLLCGLALALAGPAQAETSLWGGQAHLAIELEVEASPDGREQALGVTVIPGLSWKDGWIDRAEILLQSERGREKEGGLTTYETEHKVGLRLRKNFRVGASLRGYVRGLIGRAVGPDDRHDYAYADAALNYRPDRVGWLLGYRFVRAIDGTEGRDTDKLRLGTSFDLDERRELEFRWVRTWDANTREHRSDAWIVEYAHKF